MKIRSEFECGIFLGERKVKELSNHLTNVAEFLFMLAANDFAVAPKIGDGFYDKFRKMASKNKRMADKLDAVLDDLIMNADHRKQRGRTAPNRALRYR